MPVNPSRSDVHVNRPLSNISLAYIQDESHFVADQVFPNIPVEKQSDTYFTYDRGEFNRDQMQLRAPGTESAGSSYDIESTPVYYAPVRSLHKDIPDQVRSNSDTPINLDKEATIFLTTQALINREVNFKTKYFTAGDPGDTWKFDVDGNGTASGGTFNPTDSANNQKLFWDDAASTPIEDIREGKRFVQGDTGLRPNTLTLGREVFDILLDHPDIVGRLDRGQTTGPAQVSRDSLAALFEVDKVLVMDAIQNTANEGAASSHSFIGGKNALLSYAPATPGLMTASAGYTFSWKGFAGASAFGMRMKSFYIDTIESERVEIDNAYDQKIVGSDLGYFFGDIVQ